MIKYSGLIGDGAKKANSQGNTGGDVFDKDWFDKTQNEISSRVCRALISHFREKNSIPQSTTITIKTSNEAVDIVVS